MFRELTFRPGSEPGHSILTKTIQYQAILSDKLTIFVQTLAVRLMGIKATFSGYFS